MSLSSPVYTPQAEENSGRLFRAQTAATKQDAAWFPMSFCRRQVLINHFTIVETWHDAKAYELHAGSEHAVRFRDEIHPFLGSLFDSRIHCQFR
jgi:quinol monooxygenase YgiN